MFGSNLNLDGYNSSLSVVIYENKRFFSSLYKKYSNLFFVNNYFPATLHHRSVLLITSTEQVNISIHHSQLLLQVLRFHLYYVIY